jgi:hypothetical protein
MSFLPGAWGGLGVLANYSYTNINNEVFGFYAGSPPYPLQREFYNRTFGFGIRLTP